MGRGENKTKLEESTTLSDDWFSQVLDLAAENGSSFDATLNAVGSRTKSIRIAVRMFYFILDEIFSELPQLCDRGSFSTDAEGLCFARCPGTF